LNSQDITGKYPAHRTQAEKRFTATQ